VPDPRPAAANAPDADTPAPAQPTEHAAPGANTYALVGVKHLWSVAAALCLVAAAVLAWRGHYDATFVTATLGVVAWFLDQRGLFRARVNAEIEREEGAEVDEEVE
jgi:hypothetical protein